MLLIQFKKYFYITLMSLNNAAIAFILLLSLLSRFSYAADGVASPAASQSGGVSFTTLQNRPAIYISIENSEPFLVILDTGLGRGLMLAENKAVSLGLTKQGQQTIDNLGMGQLTLTQYHAANARIGDLNLKLDTINSDKNLSRMLKMMGKDALGNEPLGVLSIWAFKDMQVEIDLAAQQLNFSQEQNLQASSPSVVEYKKTARLPLFNVSINQVAFDAHLDSGSPASLILPYALKEQFSYIEQPVLKGNAMTAGMGHKIWQAKLKGNVQFGALILEDPEVLFMDALPQINIGLKFFKQAKLIIDTKNQLMEVIQPV